MNDLDPAIKEGLERLIQAAKVATVRPTRQTAGATVLPPYHTILGGMSIRASHLYNLLHVHQRVLQINSENLKKTVIGSQSRKLAEMHRRILNFNVNGLRTELKKVLGEDFSLEFDCDFVVMSGWRVAIPTAVYLRMPEAPTGTSQTG